jgi:hypothetical protein
VGEGDGVESDGGDASVTVDEDEVVDCGLDVRSITSSHDVRFFCGVDRFVVGILS